MPDAKEIGEWLSQVCTEKGGLDPTMLGLGGLGLHFYAPCETSHFPV